jgi:hypothetical protein
MQTESKTRLALCILAVAVALGLLADALLRDTRWGINVSLWIVCLIGGLFIAKEGGGATLRIGSVILIIPMVVFGFCFAWRDSTTLQALDLGAIVVAAALVITRQTARLWAPSLARITGSVLNLAGHCLAGFVHLIARDIDWSSQRSSVVAASARQMAVGILIAVPLLVVFTALFVRADATFARLFDNLLHVSFTTHLIPVGLGTWLAGSYLRGVLAPSESGRSQPRLATELGATELNVALGLINILFATFVAVQTQYLFGSARTVEITPGLTFSSYARRGFFELVTVALMVLPVLLAGDALHTSQRSKRFFRIQSLFLVGFVFCIMASAMHRMRLYQIEYGLTELRWYTVAFMLWLALLFLMFCGTVLRGAPGLFSVGAVASGFVGIFILHTVNPDQWIAEANFENARAGRKFDPKYFQNLSADALPTVMANVLLLPEEERKAFIEQRQNRLASYTNLRSWNYARAKAKRALAIVSTTPAQPR